MFKNIAKNKTRQTHTHTHAHEKDGRKTVNFVVMWMDNVGDDDDDGDV